MKTQACFFRLSRSASDTNEENIWDCNGRESMDIAPINFTGEVSERALNVTFMCSIFCQNSPMLTGTPHQLSIVFGTRITVLTHVAAYLISYSTVHRC
jgi:hypothetical protein